MIRLRARPVCVVRAPKAEALQERVAADRARWRAAQPPPLVTFQDASHWWVASPGTVWESSDAGQSWKSVYQQLDNWVIQPQFVDVKHGWADLFMSAEGQASGLAMTSDGGLHWTQVNAPRPS